MRHDQKRDEKGPFHSVSRDEIDGAFAIEINARLTPEIDALIDAATGNKPVSAAQKQGTERKARQAQSANGAASPRKQAARDRAGYESGKIRKCPIKLTLWMQSGCGADFCK